MAGRPEDHLPRGSDLAEAQGVLVATPAGQSVPAIIHEFLDADDRAETKREALAQSRVAEREQALAAAEEAVHQREVMGNRLRAHQSSRLRLVWY